MASENFCCDCEELDREDSYKPWWTDETKYKCSICHKYKSLTDTTCNSFKEIPKDKGSYTPSGCFITTIVCNILKYDDNCELLTILRNFRDNTLKTNPQYIPLLLQYDQVGPIISAYIEKEDNNYEFALGLMRYFLIPCVHLIKSGDIEEAIAVYQNMVMYLNDSFDLPTIVINEEQEYDLETLGKGRIRFNPKTSEI